MHLGLKKALLWIKLAVIIVVVAWVTLFFVKNANNKTDVWLVFGVSFDNVSLDWIVPVTAVVSILVYYVVRKFSAVIQQLSQVRDAEKTRDRERKMQDLARQVEKKLSADGPPSRPEP